MAGFLERGIGVKFAAESGSLAAMGYGLHITRTTDWWRSSECPIG